MQEKVNQSNAEKLVGRWGAGVRWGWAERRQEGWVNLLSDPPVQGSKEVDMPRPTQGPSFWEADLLQPAQI